MRTAPRFAIDDTAVVWVTYDETTMPDDPELVSFRVVVADGVSVEWALWRNSGQVWRSGTVTGPVDETVAAGGPIRHMSDLGHCHLRVL